jgi:hypothetical protein
LYIYSVTEYAAKEVEMKKFILLIIITLLAFTTACSGQVARETETSAPVITSPPVAEETSPPSPEPSPTAPPTPVPLEVRVLSEGEGMQTAGPWMILTDSLGFWLVNQQGDEVGFMPEFWEYMMNQWAVAPHGELVAFVQGEQITTKLLKVLSIQDYTLLQTIDLLGYEGKELTFSNEQDANDFIEDRYFAVGQPVWSSDGSKLAFVGSQEGPSPDVYIYDVEANEVTRLTSGPAHAVDLNWSPDDKYIFHAGAEKLWIGYSGSGYSGWTFYSARADGSSVITVYQSEIDQGHENIVAWYSNNQVLMDSGYWFCGRFDLRLVDIESGERATIWPGQYDQIAYDPVSRTALLWVSPQAFDTDECGPAGEPGLYLVSIPNGQWEKVAGFDDSYLIFSIAWDQQASKFILDMDTVWALVSPEGKVEILEGQPITSPDGKSTALLGYKGESLSVLDRNGNSIEIEMAGAVQYPTWSLDSSRLFFFEESDTGKNYNLYMAQAPDFTPVLIVEETFGRYIGTPTWVVP